MTDQIGSLALEPAHYQIGEPGAPCGGSSTCTDCVGCMIIAHDTGRKISAAAFRAAAAPTKDPCRGLNPTEFVRGIDRFGVHGYRIHLGVTASDAMRATDNGVVLVAVGYNGYPSPAEAVQGGRTDLGFKGPHAISLWGRRMRRGAGAGHTPSWHVWVRDPDHHYGAAKPAYDVFDSSYLVRAMDALVGNGGWSTTCAIYRSAPSLIGLRAHASVDDQSWLPELPDFGSGQAGA